MSANVVCLTGPLDAGTDGRAADAEADAGDEACAEIDAPNVLSPGAKRVTVDGAGYLVLASDTGRLYYAQRATLWLDAAGALSTADGLAVIGYADTGTTTARLRAPVTVGAHRSSVVELGVNLSASSAVAAPWLVAQPAATSNYATALSLLDARGKERPVTFYFAKQSLDTWACHAVLAGADVEGAQKGVHVEVGSAMLSFDGAGRLVTVSGGSFTIDFSGDGAAAGDVSLDFTGTTQLDTPSSTRISAQNGYPAGGVSALSVTPRGAVSVSYANAQTVALGTIALARFPVDTGTARRCGYLWTDDGELADAVLGRPDTLYRGPLVIED